MKKAAFIFCSAIVFMACSKPVPTEIKNICNLLDGTEIETTGTISVPETVETIQLRSGGAISAVGLRLFLNSDSKDFVMATFWTSDKGEPNKIRPLSRGADWSDIVVYDKNGNAIKGNEKIQVTGTIVKEDKFPCGITVTEIKKP